MRHDQRFADLWANGIRLYANHMAKTLYNLRLLADWPMRQSGLDAFLDSYSSSLDVFPSSNRWHTRRGADELWGDFVRISQDANSVIGKHAPKSIESEKVVFHKIRRNKLAQITATNFARMKKPAPAGSDVKSLVIKFENLKFSNG